VSLGMLQQNRDGSYDLYFGPIAPTGLLDPTVELSSSVDRRRL
jgi:hypothetical protein